MCEEGRMRETTSQDGKENGMRARMRRKEKGCEGGREGGRVRQREGEVRERALMAFWDESEGIMAVRFGEAMLVVVMVVGGGVNSDVVMLMML